MLRRHLGGARSHFIVGLLLLALILTGVLAFEAYRAYRSNQETAASALRDHAAFAAWRYAGHAESKLEWLIGRPTFAYLESAYGAGPRAAEVERDLDEITAVTGEDEVCPVAIRYAFRLDLRDGSFQVLEGAPPSDPLRAWVTDTLGGPLYETYDPDRYGAVFSGAPDGASHIVFYRIGLDAKHRPAWIWGFEVDPEVLPVALEKAFGASLLPPTLTGDMRNGEMVSVRVVGPTEEEIWASASDHPWDLSARDHLNPLAGRLGVDVGIRPSLAEALLIGGLPKSRLPLIAGLLLLAGTLVGAAIYVLRRELEFSRLRAEFVSNVSHELRTPMAQIRMFVETLLLGRVRSEEEQTRSLEIMNREVRRLSHLVENILAFSRAERGGAPLKLEPTPLVPLFAEVVDTFEPLAAGRNVRLRTEIDHGADAMVDRCAMRQILLNLLDNAVKYGPEGQTVTLGLDVLNGRVRMRVEDEGPGVPLAKREAIWDAFVRLDRERELATAGTGIGLSVVRDLAVRHRGRAWVEPSPTGGARFVVEIPRTQAGRVDAGPEAAA